LGVGAVGDEGGGRDGDEEMAHDDIEPVNAVTVNDGLGARGLGADRLADTLRRIAVASQGTGVGAVLVQAKDDAGRRFYRRCAAFEDYPVESRTLYLPIKTVVSAFG